MLVMDNGNYVGGISGGCLEGAARRRARQVFDLVAGFAYTQTVAACLRTDLLAVVRERPLAEAEIAARHTTAPTAATTDWPAIAALYDELVVAVLVNPGKAGLFGVEERMALLREAVVDLGYVERGEVTEEQLDAALDTMSMTHPE